jgi:hypothetical protein
MASRVRPWCQELDRITPELCYISADWHFGDHLLRLADGCSLDTD